MAGYNKQVIDIQAASGMTAEQSNEHQRRWSERGWKNAARRGNYDPTRRDLNFEIGRGGIVKTIDKSKSIPQRIKETLTARGIVAPNEKRIAKGEEPNRRTVVNIIFGGSRERMHEIAFGEQTVDLTHGADNSHITRSPDIEAWAQDIYQFACDKWGEDNIVGFYVHLDELNPHIHCTLLPILPSNKFSFKKLFAGADRFEFQARTRQLHDELAVVNARWGLGRGADKQETGARHRSTEEYRHELRQQCDELEIEIAQKRMTVAELNKEISKAERRVKGLTTMIHNLENRYAEVTGELEQLEADLAAGRGNAADLRQRISDLETKARTIRDGLEDKKAKLRIADRQLAELLDKMESVKTETADLKTERDAELARKHEQMRLRLADSIFGKTVKEIRNQLESLNPEQRAAFDNDFLNTLAEKPMELMKCAMNLMAGYVDAATEIAKGSGGGGGGSDLPWGRDPKEDDRRWSYRCMMMAHRMMKPAVGPQIKRK